MYRNLQFLAVKLTSKNIFKCTTTKTMHDIDAHAQQFNLLTSAIIAVGVLEKKERRKMMNNHFYMCGASTKQSHFGIFIWRFTNAFSSTILKVSTNTDATVQNVYMLIKQPETQFETVNTNQCVHRRLP